VTLISSDEIDRPDLKHIENELMEIHKTAVNELVGEKLKVDESFRIF